MPPTMTSPDYGMTDATLNDDTNDETVPRHDYHTRPESSEREFTSSSRRWDLSKFDLEEIEELQDALRRARRDHLSRAQGSLDRASRSDTADVPPRHHVPRHQPSGSQASRSGLPKGPAPKPTRHHQLALEGASRSAIDPQLLTHTAHTRSATPEPVPRPDDSLNPRSLNGNPAGQSASERLQAIWDKCHASRHVDRIRIGDKLRGIASSYSRPLTIPWTSIEGHVRWGLVNQGVKSRNLGLRYNLTWQEVEMLFQKICRDYRRNQTARSKAQSRKANYRSIHDDGVPQPRPRQVNSFLQVLRYWFWINPTVGSPRETVR